MRRAAGIAVGVLTHVLFGYTVWRLFWFLKGPALPPIVRSSSGTDGSLALDAILAVQFSVVHSVLLLPAMRRRPPPKRRQRYQRRQTG